MISVIMIAAPLLVVTMGALISEYAGRMAMFLEYIINLGAFFCYAFTLATGSAAAGTMLSICSCTLMVAVMEWAASHFKANMFLISLAMNMLFGSLATLFSFLLFKTRGVLYSDAFKFDAASMRLYTSIACYAFAILQLALLRFTVPGLILRVSGSDGDMLLSQGINVSRYKMMSWIIAAADGALCGCCLALRLSSYVPGLSSGRGWIALAAVFLGRKKPALCVAAAFVFALSEWTSTNIQNIDAFKNIPTSILLALPYLLSILLILLSGRKND